MHFNIVPKALSKTKLLSLVMSQGGKQERASFDFWGCTYFEGPASRFHKPHTLNHKRRVSRSLGLGLGAMFPADCCRKVLSEYTPGSLLPFFRASEPEIRQIQNCFPFPSPRGVRQPCLTAKAVTW